MYGVSLEVFLNVSSNRRFLKNVWKLLGISSLKDSRIMSSLEFFRKLKVFTENFQMLLAEIIKTLFPVLIKHTFPTHIVFHRIYTCFSKITETFSQKQNHFLKYRSRLGLSFRSVVKVELGSRIRQCLPTKVQL